jgi:hypothetical protein
MGLCEEQQKKTLELRIMTNGGSGAKESIEATGTDGASCNPALAGGCCQGNGGNTTSIDARDDPAHEELDFRTKGTNDYTL